MKPRIMVIGVGGAGGNAVNNMISAGLKGPRIHRRQHRRTGACCIGGRKKRIQLGASLTEGLVAGSKPRSAKPRRKRPSRIFAPRSTGAHMVFVAAGMGGGTGTGAASVIARIARESGISRLRSSQAVHVRRLAGMRVAEAGIAELKRHVDYAAGDPEPESVPARNDRTTFQEAFLQADQVLFSASRASWT